MLILNQAEKIRKIVLEWLEHDYSEQLNPSLKIRIISVNNKKVRAMKYKDIKAELLSMDEFDFTEGAVTGALRTLPDRIDSIFKIKNREGVFYYFSNEKVVPIEDEKTFITDSDEYEDLIIKASFLHADIGHLLRNASHGNYITNKDVDVKYLRQLLDISSRLNDVLEEYRVENAISKIQYKNPFDDLPF